MERFLNGHGCRCIVLDGVMNRFKEHVGCEEWDERCNVRCTEQDEDNEGGMEHEQVERDREDEG